MYPYIGEIRAFGFNFAPRGWFPCDGRLLSISSYTALFAIVGTTYGGNGTTNFAIPNLQGRVPMHWGNGTGGLTTALGEPLGTSTVSLTLNEIPSHTHQATVAQATQGAERSAGPTGDSYLSSTHGNFAYLPNATSNTAFHPQAVTMAGSNLPHANEQPFLAVMFGIAYQGVFPPHS